MAGAGVSASPAVSPRRSRQWRVGMKGLELEWSDSQALPAPGCAPQKAGDPEEPGFASPRESMGAGTGRRPCFQAEPPALSDRCLHRLRNGRVGRGGTAGPWLLKLNERRREKESSQENM